MSSENNNERAINDRTKANRYLNKVLWLFIVTGPIMAFAMHMGFFPSVEYSTCFVIALITIAVSVVHLILLKSIPQSIITSVFVLAALDVLIVYMTISHVNIHLMWFLVPILSIVYCDRALYFCALAMNYIFMLVATWVSAPYYAELGSNYANAESYFIDSIGGFTIETLIMAVSGYLIVKLSSDRIAELVHQREIIVNQENDAKEKIEVLDSMAEIYDNVNLISFVDNTEMSLRDDEHAKHGIDMNAQTHTLMNQRIKGQVAPDQLDDFLTFTNITTVRERLRNKKIISADFIDIISGWFRAQYITVEQAPDGLPNIVIYTTRNVDEEKKREEHLIRLSMTDDMTRLFNRRSYEEGLSKLRDRRLDDDLVVFSIDVNGLKTVNDTKGHAAGDELIKATATILSLSVRQSGNVYRTGGDEFMAIVRTDNPELLHDEIVRNANEWNGTYIDTVSLSVGYAAHKDHPEASVDDLELIADANMYAEKESFYEESGVERRHRRQSPTAEQSGSRNTVDS